ncbi:kinase-like domain-containing protein [Cladochytrium replicatum]|nr:kinase-like domain-containing protein [Cladochytrium replicatum]
MSTSKANIDEQIAKIEAEIRKEQNLRAGSLKLWEQIKNTPLRGEAEAKIEQADQNLRYLTEQLSRLQLRKSERDSVGPAGSPAGNTSPPTLRGVRINEEPTVINPTMGSNHAMLSSTMGSMMSMGGGYGDFGDGKATIFDFLRADTPLTNEKFQYRIRQISQKLELEGRVRIGTENLLNALNRNHPSDASIYRDLDGKIAETNAREAFLKKAMQKYQKYVVNDDEEEELHDIRVKRTGRLRIRMATATNVPRTPNGEIIAVIRIDGNRKAMTKPARENWNDVFDIQVDKASEVEISVYDRSGPLLGLVWFRIADLEDDLKAHYGPNYESADIRESKLNLEPEGVLIAKFNFVVVGRTKTEKDKVFRRNAVQKIYPKNGHKLIAQQFYQPMRCAVCTDFLIVGYQCTECQYLCHATCYPRVLTTCTNMGETKLKYNIPHRFKDQTIISPTWCMHCGYMLPLGRRAKVCSECNNACHRDHVQHVPNFCGLQPEIASTLFSAIEELERRKEEAEAEKLRKGADEAPTPQMPGYSVTQPQPYEHAPMHMSPAQPTHPITQMPTMQMPMPQFPASPQQPVVPLSQYQVPQQQPAQYPTLPSPPVQAPPPTVVPTPVAKPPAPVAAPASPQQPPPQPARPAMTPQQAGRFGGYGRQSSSATMVVAQPLVKIGLEDFHFLAVLGRGAFGKVMLAEEKKTKALYAIKALKKEFIIQNDDVKSTRLEKRIFQIASDTHHPFLVNLHSCFHTDTRLYFVMEYCSGGDLMCHIQEARRFDRKRTFFYACEVLLVLEYFHKNNIVYRDLKLDNILMMSDGHLKVADYGICKEGMGHNQQTRTYCGTPDYMAPEILMNHRYTRAVDWWSFGVLIYVMLMGKYPFTGEDEHEILQRILEDSIEYPSNLPVDTLDLLNKLMTKNPARRLGGGRADAQEVKNHPYFKEANWDAILAKQVPPPWKPTIRHERDISNFDSEFTREKAVLTPINSTLSNGDLEEFKGFSYTSEWAVKMRSEAK